MDLGIAGKRAVVSGASQGIGRAISLALAKEGVSVAVISRRAYELEMLVDEMGGKSAGHVAISKDLQEPGSSTEAAQQVLADGPIHIAVHNVGGTLGVRSSLASLDDWLSVFKFNVGIAIEMNRVLVPPMQKTGWGRVVHISSISGKNLRGSAPYGVTKAALDAYVKVLGREVAADGVIVSGIQPGAVWSPGGHWDNIAKTNPTMKEDFLRHHHAIGRLGTAEEIAPIAAFMCSEQVSFCAGSWVEVDGGTM